MDPCLGCYLHGVLPLHRNDQLVLFPLDAGQLFKAIFSIAILGIDFLAGCAPIPLSRTARRLPFCVLFYGGIGLRHRIRHGR